jgi:hypothetical protein
MVAKIVYVPLVHTPTEVIKKELLKKDPEAVRLMRPWTRLAKEYRALCSGYLLGKDPRPDYVFIDTLPKLEGEDFDANAAFGAEVVRKAKRMSPGYSLANDLLQKGSIVVPAEDEKQILAYASPLAFIAPFERKLRDKRDRTVARTVLDTLKDGDTGAVLMGAAHRVPEYLGGEVEMEFFPAFAEYAERFASTIESIGEATGVSIVKYFANRSAETIREAGRRLRN